MYYNELEKEIQIVLIYIRKSREDFELEKRTGEDTLARHREMLTGIAKQRGYVFELREEIESGDTISSRPVFQRVLDIDLPSGKYQAVMVTELSRLGRGDMQDAGRIINTLMENNLYIITPSKIYDIRNSSDYRQIRFELFLAREEYELIKERLLNGKLIKAARGEKPYGPGNTIGYDQYKGNLTVIPYEAELIIKVFEMRAEGKPYSSIVNYFNERGIPTRKGGKQWYNHTVSVILNNVLYLGKFIYKGKTYEGKHEPIVSQELWDSAHRVQNERTVKHTSHLDSYYYLPLYCGICGNKMQGDYDLRCKVSNPHKIMIYRCKGNHISNRTSADKLHSFILKKLKKLSDKPNFIDIYSTYINTNSNSEDGSLINKVSQLNKDIKTKMTFLDRCRKDYEAGVLPAMLYSDHWAKTKSEIRLMDDIIQECESKITKKRINYANPEKDVQILREALLDWDNVPNYKKREIVIKYLPRIEYENNKITFVDACIKRF
jgi:DNA invertase Pin-like site-specific DNA recombinase